MNDAQIHPFGMHIAIHSHSAFAPRSHMSNSKQSASASSITEPNDNSVSRALRRGKETYTTAV